MATLADRNRHDREPPERTTAAGVVVLGTGRSGTSAITRAFVSAGFFVGGEGEVLGADPANPLGHYEPLSVLEINEELLEVFECKWWAGVPAPEEQIARRGELVPRLARVLDSLIASAQGAPVAVKEPRINSLLPLWEQVIDGVLHPVLAVRDPLEIAMSHAKRDGTSIGHALAAWEAQTTLVLGWLDGRVVTVAPYAQLTAQPDLAAKLVRDTTSHLDPARTDLLNPAASGAALRPDLRHQSAEALSHDEYLTGRQADLWQFLEALPAGDALLEVPSNLREPGEAALAAAEKQSELVGKQGELLELREERALLSTQLSEAKAHAEALDQRLARTSSEFAEAELRHAREIASVQASVSWRVTAPLRWVSRALSRRSSA